ncbi:hypothetical protein X743_06385 [Mesorhizobium sp. LNHC252B00]|nr:hypothetical protein X743_06385 [Mesorhizobium sp. LNHC252B00]
MKPKGGHGRPSTRTMAAARKKADPDAANIPAILRRTRAAKAAARHPHHDRPQADRNRLQQHVSGMPNTTFIDLDEAHSG